MSDILITNADVRTMSGGGRPAEVVAVRDNRIVFVGSAADGEQYRTGTNRVIDAGGATVLPGFVEAHAHLFGGSKSLSELDFQDIESFDVAADKLKAHAASRPDADVLVARSVNYTVFGEGTRPTRHDIDRIIADRPVFLRSGDYHNAWVNTVALEKARVLTGHDVGAGSEIVIGEDGHATGELREGEAMWHVLSQLTPPGREALGLRPTGVSRADRESDKALLRQGLAHCAALGITTIHNMDGNFYQCELLSELEAAGELTCRMEIPYLFEPTDPVEHMEEASRMAREYASPMLWSGRVKMFMDGVLDAWTAVMVEPYADRPDIVGEPLFGAEQFNELAIEADRRGLQISVHAIGDGAVRMVLDGYEAAVETNGRRDSRHRIEHIEVVHPDDIGRFKALGVIASMQPIHPPGNGCFPLEPTIHMIGEARWPYAYAWRTLKDAGAEVVYGTDWPVSPADPLPSIRHACLRKPWRDGDPDQRLSLDETLAAYTRVGAFTCFKENQFGVLAPGMLADMVVLDGKIPGEFNHGTDWPKVRMTISDGRVVHE